MQIRLVALSTAAFLVLSGCSALEQYHFPQTQDRVPVEAVVAFSEARPNDVIKEIYEQKMFDGATHYRFVSTDSKSQEHTLVFTQDGKPVAGAM